jgi:hypothetical protein
MNEMSDKHKATNYETMKHIESVRNMINTIIILLLERAQKHDQSKLEHPEVQVITEYIEQLSQLSYGSPEYDQCKQEMGPALEHHYANNRHHPEHFKNGIDDMNIIDLIEMFCDWKASSTRTIDGNIRKSIEINGERFNMSDQLIKILENSVSLLD